ncbi:unnamed protein product [Rotaria sordida]|uniref:Protein quiver n=1 Tax=Rotaria sordida TaxID=392033 RepID=A0A815AQ72_9BILA|nr:unnamed protein product [Rotaria sordida]CAF1023911.1 unnamed protein product [Rotaria sordida]CAF1260437.1 unnamed protein product [Rotaria sordida]CAF1262350.1 unnamed protein product [Rotaria sordida]CAF1421822.1 unnamed protein product [Rotaria sordida]
MVVVFLFIVVIVTQTIVINSQFGGFGQTPLQCWRCDSLKSDQERFAESRKFACLRHFDFTQHSAEPCDGKCWMSYEVIEPKTKAEREKAIRMVDEIPDTDRRCFTSDDLTKASMIGLNAANGCRDVKMREKVKKFCFCDTDFCNGTLSTKRFSFVLLILIPFLLLFFQKLTDNLMII